VTVFGPVPGSLLNSHSRLINCGRKAVAIERRRRGEQQRPDVDIAALSVVKPVECIEEIGEELGLCARHAVLGSVSPAWQWEARRCVRA
jgi:hypothetical protein